MTHHHLEDFGARVLEVVDSIPAGRVLTYGDVAALLGSRAARAVGTVLAHSAGAHPWWRVVRSGGHPPRGLERNAAPHYEAEKMPLSPALTECGYRVDYAVARWNPDD
ncbi:MGMT family protein [Subtercola boreus]|uniref:DNA-binding protein n=1 Tax=Subtercola boreus TaxID=120213 RepID=A0A3E0W8B1_9MICO|nr:MGMT family protein [Subtercola boreus]RFA19372.1 DNA-binding protein [Subtercola boreus]RFA19633.1 DNA-binding protein [Subtercola boreus]RFA25998.1 DNA-binding protein [Subtercola boreus]